jgi:deoxyribodipyrimidine photo-lyase
MKRKNHETTLFWFRSDLRLNDSHALYRASFTDNPVVGVFIFSPQDFKNHDMASVKLEFLINNLRILKEECAGLNIPLIVLTEENAENVVNRIRDFALEISATSAFWNIEYEVNEGKRDKKVKDVLIQHGIKVNACHDQCVMDPGTVVSKEGRSYSVFTPFKKAWIIAVQKDASKLDLFPPPKKQAKEDIEESIWIRNQDPVPKDVEELGFKTKKLMSPISKDWPAGEEEALKRLEEFIKSKASDYSAGRDIPATNGTSRLSPYLAIGVLSVRKCLLEARKANHQKLDSGNPGLV